MSNTVLEDSSPYLMEVRHVSRLYPNGRVRALVDASMGIRAGEYVAIMGPSGSGKSTLLNLLGALDTPTEGEVLFRGRPLTSWPSLDEFRARQIGFVFQSFFLLPTLTALQNVQIPMFETELSARARQEKAEQLLATVGMSHRAKHRPMQLSVGERQRIAIARSLANDPCLLLADEPTGNLDSHTGEEMLELFDHLHRERHMALVIVTHSDEVAARAERVVRLRDGRVDEAALVSRP